MTAPSTPPLLLVLEPDADLQVLLTMALGDGGYDVACAASMPEALELLDQQTFALVLVDLFAPSREHPLRSAAELRDRASPTPVGVVTTWPVAEEEAQRQGMAFALAKPFGLEDLIITVAGAVRLPLRAEQERQAQLIPQYFAALSRRDWDAMAALCTETVTYVLPGRTPFSTIVQGRAALRSYTEETFRHFPAARFDVVRIAALPHGLIAQYMSRWRGPDDSEQEQEGAVLFQFTGEQISRIGVHLDTERLRARLAGAP